MQTETDFSRRLTTAAEQLARLREALGRVIVGHTEVIDAVLIAMLAGGHVLLEGAPGNGKTLLVKTLAQCVDLQFSRVQFTPDLMPSDITGAQVLLQGDDGRRGLALHKGPVFTQILLADEINRASPRTQSALLEAMQESAVTLAGERHILGPPFLVLATENPIEMEGTYPLPEAQLDRFLLKVLVHEPDEDDLVRVLVRTTGQGMETPPKVLSRAEVLGLQALCRDIVVGEVAARYAARIVRATSPSSHDAPALVKRAVRHGAGVRGAQSLLMGAKALAVMKGQAQVSLADVASLAKPALRHRVLRSFEGESEGVRVDAVVEAVLAAVPARPEGVESALRDRARR